MPNTMYQVKIKRNIGIQVATTTKTEDKFAQCGNHSRHSQWSYQRKRFNYKMGSYLTYDELTEHFLCDKEVMIGWLKDIGLLACEVLCPVCDKPMEWTKCIDRSDGFKYMCRKSGTAKRHRVERSIRDKTWFEKSNPYNGGNHEAYLLVVC